MKIVVLVLGILGILLGLLVTIISVALPELTSNRVNFNEALPGIIAGVLVLFVSVIIAVIGLILVLKKKK
ncbi:MAG: hypothetical protein K1X72_12590 [Pyrinomonadaceae bacterium]|nr:hypothetical protein [Pyrinomonadaceae bacterium]